MNGPSITVDTNVQKNDSKQSNQRRLSMQWDERMKFPSSRGIRHKKTSVLLLSWVPGHDDLGVSKEVINNFVPKQDGD